MRLFFYDLHIQFSRREARHVPGRRIKSLDKIAKIRPLML